MRLKLQTIEANLDAREKNRDSIIQRRVQEVMSGTGTVATPSNALVPAGDDELSASSSRDDKDSTDSSQRTSPEQFLPKGSAQIVQELQMMREGVLNWNAEISQVEQLQNLLSWPLSQWTQKEKLEHLGSDLSEEENEATRVKRITELQSRGAIYASNRKRELVIWKSCWSEYQSQLRLLQLEVDEAKLAIEPLQQKHDRQSVQLKSGFATISEITQTASDLAIAKIKVQRAEELLKVYAEIETQQPELNPHSLESEK